ncbi:MAG: dihydrolipoamide acetyltransferase family protein, partial [Planctomycetota bacterium]
MQRIIMPQVGQDIPSARIIEWCKNEGDPVEKGEVVLVVESDKASFEIEAEESGVLLKVLHEEDEEVEILKPLAYIGRPGEEIPQAEETGAAQEAVSQAAPPAAAERETGRKPGRVLASPSAKRVAKERGIDLSAIEGSGPGGRITREDVLAASQPGPAAPTAAEAEGKVVPFGKMRRRIAERLTQSNRDIPHFYLSVDVDMSAALARRKEANEKSETKITVTDLIIKACATALREFARMNAHVHADHVVLKERVNVGVAVGTDEGLMVVVIADADGKGLGEVSAEAREGAEAARRGVQRGAAAGTFTVSSLGMHDVREFLPLINPPEAGILAVGAIEKRVAPCGD